MKVGGGVGKAIELTARQVQFLEWKIAQEHAIANSPENIIPHPSHINFLCSNNGEKIRKIMVKQCTGFIAMVE